MLDKLITYLFNVFLHVILNKDKFFNCMIIYTVFTVCVMFLLIHVEIKNKKGEL